jgi:hypothetical protein
MSHCPFPFVSQHSPVDPTAVHVSPLLQLSCFPVQSGQLHPSPVLHWLFGVPLHIAYPVLHAGQFMLHFPLLHRLVPAGHGGFRLQLYVQLFVHALFGPFSVPRSQFSP